MLVRVCDNCEKRIDHSFLGDVRFDVLIEGEIVFRVVGKDFCSYGCLEQFTEDKLEAVGKGGVSKN